jgi:hypothetical protein
LWVRSSHGEGRRVCGKGLRQSLEEEAKRVKSTRRGEEMVVAEKVTRALDRSHFISRATMKGHATVHQIAPEILDQWLDWL